MLATNTPTVKEKTASGGKREWNCGGIYGMMGIGISCVAVPVFDKNGNITYTFNVMGAALFAQVTVRLGYGSNYSTVTVSSNTNGRELTFSGNLVPYSQSNIFQSGFSF